MVDISALHDGQGGRAATWRADRDFRFFAWASRAAEPGVEELRSYTGTLRALACTYTVAPSAVDGNGTCGDCQRIPSDHSLKLRANRMASSTESASPRTRTRNDYLGDNALVAKVEQQSATIDRISRSLNWERIKNASLRVRVRTLKESAGESAEKGDVRKLIGDLKVRDGVNVTAETRPGISNLHVPFVIGVCQGRQVRVEEGAAQFHAGLHARAASRDGRCRW